MVPWQQQQQRQQPLARRPRTSHLMMHSAMMTWERVFPDTCAEKSVGQPAELRPSMRMLLRPTPVSRSQHSARNEQARADRAGMGRGEGREPDDETDAFAESGVALSTLRRRATPAPGVIAAPRSSCLPETPGWLVDTGRRQTHHSTLHTRAALSVPRSSECNMGEPSVQSLERFFFLTPLTRRT